MNIDNPTTISVLWADEVVALCTPDRVYFTPSIEALPERHPVRVHVAAKCMVAGAILSGEATGPYDDDEATEAAHLLVAMRSARLGTPRPHVRRGAPCVTGRPADLGPGTRSGVRDR